MGILLRDCLVTGGDRDYQRFHLNAPEYINATLRRPVIDLMVHFLPAMHQQILSEDGLKFLFQIRLASSLVEYKVIF